MAKETKAKRVKWRVLLGGAALALVTASAAMAAFKVRRFVTTDPQFSLSRDRGDALQIEGLKYAARAKILREFTADFGRSIYAVPLAERRRRLLDVDWVEDAAVSRI